MWASRDPRFEQFARYLMNHSLVRGWGPWLRSWEEQKAQRETIARGIGRFMNGELARAWGTWHSMWSDIVAARSGQKMSYEATRKNRALKRLMNRRLAVGWLRWVEVYTEEAAFLQRSGMR